MTDEREPVPPPPDCPTRRCGHRLRPHCSNPRCTWKVCPICKAYGDPTGRWTGPLDPRSTP